MSTARIIIKVMNKRSIALPLIASVSWWCMLIILLPFSVIQIRQSGQNYKPTIFMYLSNIEDTKLKLIVVILIGFNSLFVTATFIQDYLLRKSEHLYPIVIRDNSLFHHDYFKNCFYEKGTLKHRLFENLPFKSSELHHFISIFWISVSGVSIFSMTFVREDRKPFVYYILVNLFNIGCQLSLLSNIFANVFYAIHYDSKRNFFFQSVSFKICLLVSYFIFSGILGIALLSNSNDTANVMEWIICFLYGLIPMSLLFDLKKKYSTNENTLEAHTLKSFNQDSETSRILTSEDLG